MTQINDIIETLAAAKSALDENPALKTQAEDLLKQVYALEEEISGLKNTLSIREELYTEACTHVVDLEASLESARFQQLNTSRKLNKLVSSLREDIDEIDPQPAQPSDSLPELVAEPEPVGVIAPEPKPEPDPKAYDQLFPYSGRPYSFKPDSISWREWVIGGGQRPWWLTDLELDKLEPVAAAG